MVYGRWIKRLLDFILALLLIPFVVIIVAVVGFLTKVEDGGPVLYMSNRLGKEGRVFDMIKLRSMTVNAPDVRYADGSTYNSGTDPRVTRIGKLIRKTSLDELPQIINVLRGDMSFIGPRPDLPEALEVYTQAERRKLDVRPGISGYSQAFFRNSISPTEKFSNDVFYVDNVSIWLDIKIIAMTIYTVIGGKNVHRAENQATQNASSDNLEA